MSALCLPSTPKLLPEEFPEGVIHHRSSVVDSWEEALKLLDRYPWHRLYPLRVHPEFRQKIWVEVQRRLSSEGDNEGLEHEIGLWRRVLFRPWEDLFWLQEVTSAVVRIKTHVNPEGHTIAELGREREGSGVAIDTGGLVLTIGHLMVEAYAAEIITSDGRTVPAKVVGYDHETGLGLLRATAPLSLRPMPLGRSAEITERDRAGGRGLQA